MILVVGLGNPGDEYRQTRHNLGFWAVERLATRHRVEITKKDSVYLWGKGTIASEEVIFLKPLTYMNESGVAVKKALEKLVVEDIPLSQVHVFHDELDLELGRMKIKQGGSDAGHNGLKSITRHIGANYLRYRLGVSRPSGERVTSDYVLEPFRKTELPLAERLADWAGLALEMVLKDGLKKTQGYVHALDAPP